MNIRPFPEDDIVFFTDAKYADREIAKKEGLRFDGKEKAWFYKVPRAHLLDFNPFHYTRFKVTKVVGDCDTGFLESEAFKRFKKTIGKVRKQCYYCKASLREFPTRRDWPSRVLHKVCFTRKYVLGYATFEEFITPKRKRKLNPPPDNDAKENNKDDYATEFRKAVFKDKYVQPRLA